MSPTAGSPPGQTGTAPPGEPYPIRTLAFDDDDERELHVCEPVVSDKPSMFCRLDDFEHVDVTIMPAATYSGSILPADSPPIVAPYRGGTMPTTMLTDADMRTVAATIPGATYVDWSRSLKAIPPVRRSVVSARPRERRSPCSTRRRKTASSASSGSSGDPDLGEPPGACWRLREALSREIRWRLFYARGASA